MTPTTESTSFSALLRAGSRADHAEAEHSGFVVDLFGGHLPIDAYAAMLGQLWFVYRSLEAANARLADDPIAGPFVDAKLDRLTPLEADLAFFGIDDPNATEVLPATAAFADRLAEVGGSWPGGWVAHHYTRYLGDLSGGQAIRSVVQRTYGLADGHGTTFYDFGAIDDRRAYKDGYRAKLDTAPWSLDDRGAVIDEVAAAYAFNTAVFDDLGQRFRA
jgi:heme oxygenase